MPGFGTELPPQLQLIEALRLPKADVSLGLLYNNLVYTAPSSDSLFGAQRSEEIPSYFSNVTGEVSWIPQRISVFACAEQHLLCNPSTGQCSDYDAVRNLGSNLESADLNNFELTNDIGLNKQQNGLALLILKLAGSAELASLLNLYGGPSLLAQDKIMGYGGVLSTGLSDNQTAIEIQNWFQIQLAFMQRAFLRRPRGPSSPDFIVPAEFTEKLDSDILKSLCHHQKVHHPSYTSFSMLGLMLTILFGALIIGISFALEPVVAMVRNKSGKHSYRQLEWDHGELLHLHSKPTPVRPLNY
jgi:hypothetical protein